MAQTVRAKSKGKSEAKTQDLEQELYPSLFKQAADGIFVTDGKGMFIDVNPRGCKMLGYTRHEILSMNFSDLIPLEDLKANPYFTDELLAGKILIRERRLRCKKGNLLPVEISEQLLSNGHFLWIVRDITERKQTEEALQESEEKYRNLVERANDGIAIIQDGRVRFANSRLINLWGGGTVDEVVGSPFTNYIHPDELSKVRERYQRRLAGDAIGSIYETKLKRKNGSPVSVELNAGLVTYNGKPADLVIIRDITERKQAEEARRTAEASYRALVEQIPAITYIDQADGSGTSSFVSPQIESMLGIPPQEWMQGDAKYWAGMIHPDDSPRVLAAYRHSMETGQPFDEQYRMFLHDERMVWIDNHAVRLKDASGQPGLLHGVMFDITARKQSDEALRALSTRQEAILAAFPDILVEVDNNKRYTWANPAGMEFFGDDVLGKEAAYYFAGEQDTYEQAEPLFKGDENVIHLESWQRRKDGEKRLLAWRCRTIKDREGNVTGVISSAHDITESRRYERELEASTMFAQALNETLELQPLLEKLLEAACHAIPAAEKGSLAMMIDAEHLQVQALSGYRESGILGYTYPITWGYAGRAARQHRPLLVSDIQEDNELKNSDTGNVSGEVLELRSAIVIPLLVQETVIGVLSLESTQPAVFSEGDLRLLVNFAVSAALIIERARLFEETRRRAEETASLLSTSLALSRLDLQATLQSIGDHAKTLFAADGCRIFLLEPDGKTLRCVLALLENPVAFTDLKIKLGEGVTGAVAASGQAEIVNDMTGDSRAVQVPGTEEEPEAIMFAPLQEQDRTSGVISIRRVGRNRPFHPADLELLKAFASMAASAVSSTRMFEETRKRVAELETLNRISIAVRAIMNQDEMLAIVLEETLNALNASHGSISLLNESTGKLHKTVARGWLSEFAESPIKPGEGIFGNVFSSGNAHVSRDFANDEFTRPDMRSQLRPGWGGVSVPIRSTEKTLGVMLVSVPSERELTRDEVRLLNTLAEMTGNALHRMGLYGETVRRAEEFASLYEMHTAISAEHELDTLLQTIVKNAAVLLDATASGIYIYDPANEELQVAVTTHPAIPVGTILQLGEGAAGRVAQSRQPLRVGDYSTWEGRSQKYGTTQIRAALEVPILFGGELIGVLVANEIGTSERKFSQGDERLLSLYATQAAGAIRSARLHKETQRRLENLQALREVDRVITSSFDLRPILNTVLNHTITQLGVDAADILMLNPALKTLEFAGGYGFHTRGIERSHLRLGEGHAGRAILQRRIVHVSNLPETGSSFMRAALLTNENFLEYYGVPLISKGEVKGLLEVFHRSPLRPSPEWMEFLETLAGQAAIAIDNSQLFENIQRTNMELGLAYEATIEGWSRAMDLRDEETEGHTQRVSDKAISLARTLGMQDDEIVHLRRGALLHDIGKIGVPDHILLKTGDLTDDEWVIMRKHPQFAYEMLHPIAYLRPSLDIPYMHHEKWDGSGYPRGLKGEQIPLAARIFAIVDVYDALTSDRPYRKAWTKAEAQKYILTQSGKHFDPQVVEKFLQLFGDEAG